MMLDHKKRKNVLQKIAQGWEYYMHDTKKLADISRIPIIGSLTKPFINNIIKYEHAGQVVNYRDALDIIDLAENHVVFSCACRKLTGTDDKMCCINFGPMKDLSTRIGEKMEEVDAQELKLRIKEWCEAGLFSQILYATAPYPIALCMCERKYCVSAKYRFVYDYPLSLLKGHEVAIVLSEKCKGCQSFECMSKCQFGAMFVDRVNGLVVIDPTNCFGCGLCMLDCKKGAIYLKDRTEVPAAKGKW